MLRARHVRSLSFAATSFALFALGACAASSREESASGPVGAQPAGGGQTDAAAPAVVCEGGSLDCNGEASDGCEVDPTSNGEHCGACGHDCLGGACVGGACRPAHLFAHDFGPGGYAYLAADETYLYFSTDYTLAGAPDTAIAKVPLRGGDVTGVVDSPGHALSVSGMAVDEDSIAIKDVTGLQIAPKAGGAAKPLETPSSVSDYSYLALHKGQVFVRLWHGDFVAGELVTVPKTGGAARTLFVDDGIASFAVDDEYVYWVNCSFQVKKIPIDGGAATTLATLTATGNCPEYDLVHEGGRLFFDGYYDGIIHSIPTSGGPSTVFLDKSDALAMTGGGGIVYWQNGTSLFASPAGDTAGTPTTIAVDAPSRRGAPLATAKAIYWVGSDGLYGLAR